MRKFYIVIILKLIFAFILVSCKKNDYVPQKWNIPNSLSKYYDFKKGSEWIYVDSVSGKHDTVTVKKNYKGTFFGERGDEFEESIIDYYSSHDGFTYEFEINTFGSARCIRDNGSNHPCYLLFVEKFKPGEFIGEGVYFSYPFIKNNWGFSGSQNPNSKYEIIAIYDSLKFDSTTYNNVVKIFINSCITYNNHDIIFYWSEDYGIIRREDLTNMSIWKLKSHTILK